MPGTKGRSGAPGRKAYPGAGRPPTERPVQLIRLSPPAAAKLATITKWRRLATLNPKLSQRAVVEQWIEENWSEVDQTVEANAE